MSSVCPICVKVVLDSEEGVCCDGVCERWFHRECVKMSKTDYQRISSDNNIKWHCGRADCGRIPADPINVKLDEILSRLSSLATKQELADGLREIKQDLDRVTTKLEEFEPRLALVESEVLALKNNQVPNITENVENIFAECNDRIRRSKNIIIYNLPESNSATSVTVSKANDAKLIENLLGHMRSQIQLCNTRHYRIGKKSKGKSRPLVLCMPSESEAVNIFKNFKGDDLPDNLKGISLSHDRTPRERKYLEQLRSTLKSRQDAGEKNLTIKFINGIPSIVEQKNL